VKKEAPTIIPDTHNRAATASILNQFGNGITIGANDNTVEAEGDAGVYSHDGILIVYSFSSATALS